jgi:APA family basic amino acid/polyamine antiporter
MAKALKSDTVFLRKSTGLVREMSPTGALIYNVLTMGVAPLVYVYITAAFAFPDGNVPWAFVITGAISCVAMLAYAMLASSLPRSGGDYVYQTRSRIPGFWAFSSVFASLVLWQIGGAAIAGWFVANVGVAPLFTLLGVETGSSTLLNLGVWCTQPLGESIIAIVVILLTLWAMIHGLRLYQRIQTWFAISLAISIVLMLVLLLTTSHADFVANLNLFMAKFGSPNFYDTLLQTVKKNGYNPAPNLTLLGTLGIAPAIWTQFSVAMWSVQQGGEIKSAGHLNRQVYMIIGALVILTLIGMALAALINNVFGRDFVNALAYAESTGTPPLSYVPFFHVLIASLSHNVLIEILIPLGFLANAIQFVFNSGLGPSRIALAMSFDGLLPAKVGEVSEKYHTPVFTLTVFYALAAAVALLYLWITRVQTYFLSLGMATSVVILTTMVAAIIFPFTAKSIYNGSPASRYRVFGMPVISIAGAIGFIWTAVMIALWLTVPALGVANLGSMLVIAGTFVICIVYYFVWSEMKRRRGMNLAQAFAEIPPE